MVVFENGKFTATVSVLINDDIVIEIDEVFLGRLRNTGICSVNIIQDEAMVTILHNDSKYQHYCINPDCEENTLVPHVKDHEATLLL